MRHSNDQARWVANHYGDTYVVCYQVIYLTQPPEWYTLDELIDEYRRGSWKGINMFWSKENVQAVHRRSNGSIPKVGMKSKVGWLHFRLMILLL